MTNVAWEQLLPLFLCLWAKKDGCEHKKPELAFPREGVKVRDYAWALYEAMINESSTVIC